MSRKSFYAKYRAVYMSYEDCIDEMKVIIFV